MWALRWWEDCSRDAAFAVRQWRKSPGFTAIAALSLALGIGANTAILTLIESTLLRPIAVAHPERLRLLAWKEQRGGWVPPNLGSLSPAFGTIYEQRPTRDGGLMHIEFPPRLYEDFRRNTSLFESLFAFKELGRVGATVEGNAEPVNCFLVSGDFYRGLGIHPVIGRAITPNDDVRSASGSVALISYQYWTRRFARSPSALGKKITLNGLPVTIIGVNPEYFRGVEPGADFEIWAPLNLPPALYGSFHHGAGFRAQPELALLDEHNAWVIPIMTRLKAGVSDSQAEAALNAIFQAHVDGNPGPLARFLKDAAKRPQFRLQSGGRGVDYLTQRYERLLVVVLSLAGLVLLIACVDVANLLLAKSAARQREISLRLALGSGRWRVARQMLAEGLLLAALAGAGGVLFGYATRNTLPALLATPWGPNPFETAFDSKVLLASAGLAFAAGMLFSIAPMWQSRRVEVHEALKEGSRGTTGISKLRVGRLLVAVQIAISIFLLVGTGLCVETFTNLRNIPLGLRPEGVWLFSLDLPRIGYSADKLGEVLTNLQVRLRAMRGAGPATFTGAGGFSRVVPGNQKPEQTSGSYTSVLEVGSGFFETMGIPILYGRGIEPRDRTGGPLVAVVNQKFARLFFPGEDPVGKIFRAFDDVAYEIVGVCGDWRADRFRDPIRPAFYPAWMQQPHGGSVDFAVRLSGEPRDVAGQIRETVRLADPELAVAGVHTESQQIENALSQERFIASLAAIFGGLALLLAAIGIYGVMAYAVTRRTPEIGIRVALGARPGVIAWMMLRETLLLAAAGAALGVAAVLGSTPLLDHFLAAGWRENFIYGLKPDDPATIVLAALGLTAVAVVAGYLPARRAASTDPREALVVD